MFAITDARLDVYGNLCLIVTITTDKRPIPFDTRKARSVVTCHSSLHSRRLPSCCKLIRWREWRIVTRKLQPI